MKKPKTARVLITVPVDLLKKIDALAKKAGMNRAAFICDTVERKLFADGCRETFGGPESK